MKVLLTGSTGFIGSSVLSHLRSLGHTVICANREGSSHAPVDHTVSATLGTPDFCERVSEAVGPCDSVVHCAAKIDYDPSNAELIQVNCLGTQQVIELAETWKSKSLVYLSSVPVIGKPQSIPITESHPVVPATTYHATKLFGEQLVSQLTVRGVSGTTLRIPAPVGPGMPNGRILTAFVERALTNQPLTLLGQGTRRQNYVDVRDIGSAIESCLQNRPDGVFQIAGPRDVSNVELAQACIETCGSSSIIEFADRPDPADNEVWDVSFQKANEAFGYQPKHELKSSIQAVIKDYEGRTDQ